MRISGAAARNLTIASMGWLRSVQIYDYQLGRGSQQTQQRIGVACHFEFQTQCLASFSDFHLKENCRPSATEPSMFRNPLAVLCLLISAQM